MIQQPPLTYSPPAPIWCAGCGHYAVLNALKAAVRDLELPLDELAVLAGIGCSGTIQNYVGAYGYHALHGRVLPAATGLALANPKLTVVAAGGDGDGYAIGAGHLVHAFRRNVSFTYLLMNNEIYGLTKGQQSPGHLLDQNHEVGLSGPLLGLSIPGTTFVARGYSGRFDQLVRLVKAALEHSRAGRGFAFLEVISPCVTYADTYARWEHVLFDVDADDSYDHGDRVAAFATAIRLQAEGRIPAGLLFSAESAARRARRPAPASVQLDADRTRYESILDGYAVGPGAGKHAPDQPSLELPLGPRVSFRPLAPADHASVLDLVNEDRLPGQPAATEEDLVADLGRGGSVFVATADSTVIAAACSLPSTEGPSIAWVYARHEVGLARQVISHAVEQEAGLVGAFTSWSAIGWGVPGISRQAHAELDGALKAFGFKTASRWRYMLGKPAHATRKVADVVKQFGPHQWVLRMLYDSDPVAECKIEAGDCGDGIVRWIGVAEAFRRQGMGRALLDEATQLLGSLGTTKVSLYFEDSPDDEVQARALDRFYSSAGFVLAAELLSYRRTRVADR